MVPSSTDKNFINQALTEINDERRNHGVDPLAINEEVNCQTPKNCSSKTIPSENFFFLKSALYFSAEPNFTKLGKSVGN